MSNSANSHWVFVCDKCDLVKEVNYYSDGSIRRNYYIDKVKKEIKGCDDSWQGN